MVRTELHIPEADKEEQKRGRIEKKWIGRVQTVLEGLTLAAIVYYACVAQHQWKEMQRAAKAAEGANTIARDALVRSNRPWVGVSEPVQIQGKLILSPKLVVNSYVTMKNYGQSPAFHVLIDVNPVSDYSKLAEQANISCTRVEQLWTMKQGSYGPTTFPASEMRQRGELGDDRPSPNITVLYLAGCIIYGDQFDDKVIHHTRFCAETPGMASNFPPNGQLVACNVNQGSD